MREEIASAHLDSYKHFVESNQRRTEMAVDDFIYLDDGRAPDLSEVEAIFENAVEQERMSVLRILMQVKNLMLLAVVATATWTYFQINDKIKHNKM